MQSEYKLTLPFKTVDDAAGKASELLKSAQKTMGFVPNMYTAMANSPALYDTYTHGYQLFRSESGFSLAEQEIVFLTISRENGCNYCVAAHSFIADKMSNVPEAVTDAIRNGETISEPKFAQLVRFTQTMVSKRGLPTQDDVEDFLAVGYTQTNILDIILAISVKTISNYTNHLFHTELDEVFTARAW